MGLKNGTNAMVAIIVFVIVILAIIATCVGSWVRRRFQIKDDTPKAMEMTTPRARRVRNI